MCQTSVMMEQDDSVQLLLENVTTLEVIDGGLVMATLFERQKEYPGLAIRRIDFIEGKVYLFRPQQMA